MLVPVRLQFEDDPPEPAAAPTSHAVAQHSTVAGNKNALSLHNATIEFGPVKAVDQVSLDVHPGEFLCIVGPSGCGKTTLLNYAAGLLPTKVLTGGTTQVLGGPPREGHERLAYMLARDSLLPWRTALGNAEFGAEARGVPAAERRARALQLLARVGLKGFEHSYPKALSHGMRQRVALARTFCLDADLLLMDEPFGALDAQTKLQLEDLLLELSQESRKTVVFITHDLSEAIALGDRVIVMAPRPGRIIAEVPIHLERPRKIGKLQKDPAYHEYYAKIWTTLEEGFAA
jgi:NitT/TauT family transport system ATP-binding protein